jgi:5-methylcytosine-specific restriction enzyme A
MPSLRRCLYPGCTNYVRSGSRCDLPGHGWHGKWPTTPPEQRGYGSAWRALRLRILARDNHRCVLCGAKATDVDHITPKSQGGTDHPSNLRSLCKRCHRAKTEREWKATR